LSEILQQRQKLWELLATLCNANTRDADNDIIILFDALSDEMPNLENVCI